jgi:hypothetical protein
MHEMENVGKFYSHLMYFRAIRYILWPLVFFLILVSCGKKKSGNPGMHTSSQRNCLLDSYLAASHVGHRSVGLDRLQLIQAPVQLLQSLDRKPDVTLI